MYLIDESYFNKNLFIPNINEFGDSLNDLESYIDEYVPQLLRSVLGVELFADFEANQPLEPKWANLLNGVEYGDGFKWLGLLKVNGISKRSLLANYVFFFWLKDKISQNTGLGAKVSGVENTNSVSSVNKLVEVWNEFVNEYGGTCSYFPDVYYKGGYTVVDWFTGSQASNYVSLTQFLLDNPTDYPNPQLQVYKPINSFSL